MNYPCLYDKDEIYISAGYRHIPEHDGIGQLSDAESCVVTQETDGTNELSLTYPCSGRFGDRIYPGMLLRANTSRLSVEGYPLQFYRIVSTERRMTASGEMLKAQAEHLSYDLKWHWCKPYSVRTQYFSTCIGRMKANALNSMDPFDYVWDGPADEGGDSVELKFDEASTKKEGIEEIQRLLGLCLEQDNLNMRFSRGGRKTGIVLEKGKNLSEFAVYTDQSDAITGVYVYYKDSSEETYPTIVSHGGDPFVPHHYTVFNYAGKHPEGEFDAPADLSIVPDIGNAFLRNRTHGDPVKSYSAKIADTGDDIALYDIVTVEHKGFGVNTELQVTKLVYDVLRGRYTDITAGGNELSFAKNIAAIKNAVKG